MNNQNREAYDQLPEDNELISHYQPTFLARGGDHLVYEVLDHPDVVIKASTYNIKDILTKNAELQIPLDTISQDQKEELEGEVSIKTEQIKELRKYFGNNHTLSERRYLMKVPITKDLLDEVFKADYKGREIPADIESVSDAWTTVVVQQKTEQINNPEHLGLYFGGFLEQRKDFVDCDEGEYKDINDQLVCNNEPMNLELFFKLQDNPKSHSLIDLISKAEKDLELRDILIELINKIIGFADETGNILALAGKDNVILYQKNDQWNYLLVDALSMHDEPVFSTAKDSLVRYFKGEILDDHEKSLMMKAMNFVRTVNGLATILGIDKKLDLLSDENRRKEVDFSTII